MTFAFILVLTLAVMLGPILLIQPSKRQKYVTQLRRRAAEQGLSVSTTLLDGEPYAVYTQRWSKKMKRAKSRWQLLKKNYQHEVHLAGYWQYRTDSESFSDEALLLENSLVLLPEDAAMVEANDLGIAVTWKEARSEDGLERIVTFFNKLGSASTG